MSVPIPRPVLPRIWQKKQHQIPINRLTDNKKIPFLLPDRLPTENHPKIDRIPNNPLPNYLVFIDRSWAVAAGIYGFRRLPRVINMQVGWLAEVDVLGGTAASHYGSRRLQDGRIGEL